MATMYVTFSIIGIYWWPLPIYFIAYICILLCFVAIATAIMDNTKIIGENPYAASWSLSCTLDHNKYMFVLFLQYDLPI